MKLRTSLAVSALVLMSLSFQGAIAGQSVQGQSAQGQTSVQGVKARKLMAGQWDTFNKKKIEALLATYGKTSPQYDPQRPPYAVFDWDNTSIFLDIGEATFIYQLENLVFSMDPQQLDTAIRMNISDQPFSANYKNQEGKEVDIDLIAPDIVESYTWLYQNYKGLKGTQSLDEVKKNPHYTNFITKMRYLYEAIGDTFDHATSYPWLTYLNTGMTERQVRDLTFKATEWQLKQPIESVTWTSPSSLPGKAGVLSISWKNGLRLVPEMQDLYKALRDSGIDVWIVTASFADIVKEISSNQKFGYHHPSERVLGMELVRDAKGVIQSEFPKDRDQTQGKGKTRTIERFLESRYGYGPILVAGDSEGDQNMMADFPDTKLVLIINRLRSPESDIGKLSKIAVDTYGMADAKYLLQGRDDNKGTFVKSQLHYKLGSQEGKALK